MHVYAPRGWHKTELMHHTKIKIDRVRWGEQGSILALPLAYFGVARVVHKSRYDIPDVLWGANGRPESPPRAYSQERILPTSEKSTKSRVFKRVQKREIYS